MSGLITNYVFEVKIGVFNMSFSKVTNLVTETEYEIIGDGGNNDKMQFFNKPKRKPDTIIFEKGIKINTADAIYSLLIEGVKINNIIICVKKENLVKRIFYIDQGIITKKSFGNLDALNGEVFIRKLELAHTGLVEVSV